MFIGHVCILYYIFFFNWYIACTFILFYDKMTFHMKSAEVLSSLVLMECWGKICLPQICQKVT